MTIPLLMDAAPGVDPLPPPAPPPPPIGGGFSSAGIVAPGAALAGTSVILTWDVAPGAIPAGSIYQVYIDKILVYSGPNMRAIVPAAASGRRLHVDVGWVAPA